MDRDRLGPWALRQPERAVARAARPAAPPGADAGADAAEEVTRSRPDLLAPYTQTLLERVGALPEPEVSRHVAQLVPRLPLTPAQRVRAVGLLEAFLEDRSRIVQTCALQGLVVLTAGGAPDQEAVLTLVRRHADDGSPAVRARARRLLDAARSSEAVVPRGPVRASSVVRE